MLLAMITRCAVSFLVATLLALAPVSAFSQSETIFDDVNPSWADAAYLGIVIPLDIALTVLPERPNSEQNPLAMDRAARGLLSWQNKDAAATVSDVALYSMVTTSLVSAPLFEWSVDEPELAASMVALEALATTALVTNIMKHVVGRQRPYAYGAGLDEGYDSFFSGHTSMTFASATLLTVYAYEYNWLSDTTRWIVPASTYLIAGFTGYLRVAADRHWLTDVLVGAIVGTGTSYLVYALRTGG